MSKKTRRLPKGNIYWREVTSRNLCVRDAGSVFIAQDGRRQAVVNWGSQDAQIAQSELRRRAKSRRGCRR